MSEEKKLTPDEQESANKLMKMLVEQSIAQQQKSNPEAMAKLLGIQVPEESVSPKPTLRADYDTDSEVVKDMDEDEILRLENLLLKEQMENLRREMVSKELNQARQNLQNFLHAKHGVNPETHKISLDVQKNTLTISRI